MTVRSQRRGLARGGATAAAAVTLALGAIAPAAGAAEAVRPDVVELTIGEASDLLARHATTSVALVDEYIARIAAYDDAYGDQPGLHAVIAVNEQARQQAAALDAERAAGSVRGPLHGVPIIVKDNIDMLGMPTTNGAIAFASYKPKNDATVIRRLKAAGAIVVAKANLSEFAWNGSDSKSGLGGEVRNPYDQSKTASGSSGGTAAAVAASFATAGLGSDTFGSIRNPAANQALVGVRPTHGLVSLTGVTPQVEPQDTVGPLAKSVEDAAILLDATAGYDPSDHWTTGTIGQVPESYAAGLSTTALAGKKLLTFTNASFHGGSGPARAAERAEVAAIQDAALAQLEAQGATVERVELTADEVRSLQGRGWLGMAYYLDGFFARNDAFWPVGLAARAAPTDRLTTADYVADDRETPQIKPDAAWLLSTAGITDTDLATQDARAAAALAAWKRLLADHDADAVAIPTDALAASPVTEDPAGYSENADNASLSSGMGTPAVVLPVGYTQSRLPVSLQLIGLPYAEGELLAYAYDYERATRTRVAPPTTPELAHPAPPAPPAPLVPPVAPPVSQPAAPAPVAPAVPAKPALSLSVRRTGAAKVGRSLGVRVAVRSSSGTSVSRVAVSYRWYVGGKRAGSSRTLKLTKRMTGKRVTVRVTVSKAGYRTVSRTVLLTRKVTAR
ncbi:amidase [Conexibacter stalactiti]|uniref:Amidase n=1 Tax=Conexibacter stalactiti TaxID=1940611 RepID=A0ABU4HIF6_9ACTN|nr:amidase [Conexibacter stalactiti]MDW5593098.1 amidase [Conexibacter stalactiti]MEC5033739.1 amidase [Conexibacter stalactiti]